MNLLDLLIVALALGYAWTGFRNGAVVGALSLGGFFLGAAVGANLAGPLGSLLAAGRAQVPVALGCVLVLAMIGQLLGVWLAGSLKARLVHNSGRRVDSGIGSMLGVASVLLVSWMVAVPLASSPYPELAAEASQSSIVRGVDDVMPDGMRRVYSHLRTYLDRSGFPPVFGDLPSTAIVTVDPPVLRFPVQVRRAIDHSAESVFKIYAQAPSCGRSIEGSGFVFARDHLMTNAHVVAGARQVAVVVDGRQLRATVVLYDPRRDVAVLDVAGLDAQPLRFAARPAAGDDSAVVVGYPQDGSLTLRSARIRERVTASGADIYGNDGVSREIYSIRSSVRSGNSGGPLLSTAGTVLGIVFATDLRSADTGYVLSTAEVASAARAGRTASAAVSTQRCAAG